MTIDCAYCGRESQPGGAVNCCGCGAPLCRASFDAGIALPSGMLYTPNELRRVRGDADVVEVTTFADHARKYLPCVPQAKPIKRM